MSDHRIARARNTFFAGLLIVVPVAVTVWITYWIFALLTGYVPWIVKRLQVPLLERVVGADDDSFMIRVLCLFILLSLIWFVGLIAKTVVVRKIISWFDTIILRLPMVNTIYSTIQQVGRAVFQQGEGGMFQKVVLVEYPRREVYAIAFVTAEGYRECCTRTGHDLISLFLPTTPNPTSGFLLLVPRDQVFPLDISVTDAMRLVISGGVVHPPGKSPDSRPDRDQLP